MENIKYIIDPVSSKSFEDMTNKIYSNWKVDSFAYFKKDINNIVRIYWNCICINCTSTNIFGQYKIKNSNTNKCNFCPKLNQNNLTGQKFNRLTAIEYSDKNISGKLMWKFLCDCGNTLIAIGSSVKNGYTKSCGCLKTEKLRETKKPFFDLSGLILNGLEVINFSHNKILKYTTTPQKYWNCKCINCKKEQILSEKHLTKSNKKSNKCIHCIESTRLNIVGQKFHRLLVLNYSHTDKHKKPHWNCICDCGNVCIVDGNLLKRNHTKSCGCLDKENKQNNFKDLTNKKFNFLTALKYIPKNQTKTNQQKWLCQCICGNITKVSYRHLVSGRIKSCGCENTFNLYKKLETPKKFLIYILKINYIKSCKTRSKNIKYYLNENNLENTIFDNCRYCGDSPQINMYINSDFKSSIEKMMDRQKRNNQNNIDDLYLNTYLSKINLNDLYHQTLDRVSSDGDYTIDNIVPSCKKCNTIKNDSGYDDFLYWCYKIYYAQNFLTKNNFLEFTITKNLDKKTIQNIINIRLKEYQVGAKTRNIDFNMDKKEFAKLLFRRCNYCGNFPNYITKILKNKIIKKLGTISKEKNNAFLKEIKNLPKYYHGGVDRLEKNYDDKNNCVPCCRRCNIAKMNIPRNVFISQVTKIVKHHKLEEKYGHLTEDELYPKYHLREKTIAEILKEDLGLSGEEVTPELLDFLENIEENTKDLLDENYVFKSKEEKNKI